ncbi:RNA polymerase sigma factor, sigma-70 family [Sulfobacillus acidophilus DSM 10332]|uniref:RNA polymerase sigma factor SigS n=1 Tax=Sulfobacillus acidophilus (strain ATCC 700253 / DSM 10332 / NAL) TaxID=679936 RepID=G8TUI6_SULAD|nr:RNA polymerase sigma factor, sigma-70 family [Sulfobacillus acidophilus DSM 10332]
MVLRCLCGVFLLQSPNGKWNHGCATMMTMNDSKDPTTSTGPGTWEEVVDQAPRIFRAAFAKAWMRQSVPGALREDVQQEAWIGLWQAWRAYDARQGAWEPWAVMVVRRRVSDYIRRARRFKHHFLNAAFSLDRVIDPNDADHRTGYDWIGGRDASGRIAFVEDAVLAKAMTQWLARQIVLLTPLERATWCGRQAGESLDGIAHRLGRPWKSVENAWQRTKRKLRQAWRQEWGGGDFDVD